MKRTLTILFLVLALIVGCAPQEEVNNMPGLSPLAVEFTAAGQALDFGILPRLNNLSSISVSAWIYQDTDPGVGAFYAIADLGGGGMGWYFTTVKDRKLRYDHAGDPGSVGTWMTAANAITLSTWQHVVFTRDNTNINNVPVMYINGSAVEVTGSAQIGANPDETVASFMVGNLLNSYVEYTWTFDGKIFDVRVYRNYILTQANVTALFNGGTPSMSAGPLAYEPTWTTSEGTSTVRRGPRAGLIFQAFAVRDEELASYVDAVLPGNVFEAQFKAVGTMEGNVTGRAAP